MIVIIGLIVLLVAVVVGMVGVLGNAVQTGRNRDRPFRPWSRLRRPVISARRDAIR